MAETSDQSSSTLSTQGEPRDVYEYEPLPTPTSIRLIKVEGKDEDGAVHVRLKTIDLKDAPWFHAVSYTWGNPHTELPHVQATHAAYSQKYPPEYREPIVANGKLLYVSRSAHDILVSMPKDAWAKRCNQRNPNNQLRASIHSACMTNKKEYVEELISAGVDIDVQDEYGRTPLSYAARLGKLDFVELLLAASADLNIVDGNNNRPLDHARESGAEEVIKCLEGAEKRSKVDCPSISWPEGPQMWCWVDQICIDQSNLEERASQVSIMDQIYECASYTLIWLGLEDDDTEVAVETIQKLYSAKGDLIHANEIIPYTHQPKEIYAAANIPYVSLEEWKALATLFLRPYLRRLWVIQENILSDTCLGYCGKFEVPWRAFCTVAQQIYFRQLVLGRVTSTDFIDINSPVVAIESEIVHLTQWKDRLQKGERASMPKALSLENLLFETWTFRSTDPRDKVFGLYGLLLKAGPVPWKPDYSKSIAQVYADTTKEIIRNAGELRMLSAVLDRSLHNVPDLPSWVPDYSVPFVNMMCSNYNAAGNLPQHAIQPSPWNVLPVSGVKIDTVLQTGNTTSGPKQMSMFFDARWFELALLLPHPYHNGQARTEALWRTLCADQKRGGSFPAPTAYGDFFRRMLCRLTCVKAEETARAAEHDPNLVVLEAALYHIRQVLSNPPISNLPSEEIQRTFGDPDKNLSSADLQTLTHLLYKLHFLGVVEEEDPWTPTIDEIEESYRSTKWQTWEESSALPGDDIEFHEALRSKLGRRRLFVTEKRYLGLGPASMLDGDEVWVIPGAGAAFVLRPVEQETFSLIGAAYVHGAMNGEAVEQCNAGLSSICLV
ncbi:hypothetical protein BDV27DRAFT_163403 [Aspergillus caelatus]|uniref:Heterokaryon incompatibility domain-containing protein n=1 Tax=Aspergillus caelatus TaxID=61420 RepID=A0A5N6ZM00_9EURO|nr:uncharacterized protein BDV27DRAFT_163403 [Aspergillus caelatus]KAE8358627.1 hypothetical protein BDV27DRAFT_163403 [Aspergillus caelatus]